MKIRYYVADKSGCIILPRSVMTAAEISSGDLLYLSVRNDFIRISKIPDNISPDVFAVINEQGVIDYPLLELDEPYKLLYGFDNIIYCSRKFY